MGVRMMIHGPEHPEGEVLEVHGHMIRLYRDDDALYLETSSEIHRVQWKAIGRMGRR